MEKDLRTSPIQLLVNEFTTGLCYILLIRKISQHKFDFFINWTRSPTKYRKQGVLLVIVSSITDMHKETVFEMLDDTQPPLQTDRLLNFETNPLEYSGTFPSISISFGTFLVNTEPHPRLSNTLFAQLKESTIFHLVSCFWHLDPR